MMISLWVIRTIRPQARRHVDSIGLIGRVIMLRQDNGPTTYKGTGIMKPISIRKKKWKFSHSNSHQFAKPQTKQSIKISIWLPHL